MVGSISRKKEKKEREEIIHESVAALRERERADLAKLLGKQEVQVRK